MAKCIPKSVKNIQTNKMESANVCMVSIKTPNSKCNANYGGELVLQPSADGNSMVWGCQCNYPDYVSENPSGKDFVNYYQTYAKKEILSGMLKVQHRKMRLVYVLTNIKWLKILMAYRRVLKILNLALRSPGIVKIKIMSQLLKQVVLYPCLGNNSFC